MNPYYSDGPALLYQGDCRDVLAKLPAASVQCVVTSPPYWAQRDYGLGKWVGGDPECEHAHAHALVEGGVSANKGNSQVHADRRLACRCGAGRESTGIGLEPTPQAWVDALADVMREVRRVLRDDGTVWLNLGDKMAGSGGANNNLSAGVLKGIPTKNHCLLPERLAIALQEDGWIVRRPIIWHKPACMPQSVDDAPTLDYEFIYLLAKSNTATYWTHRDLPGTRTQPKPDYRWQRRAGGVLAASHKGSRFDQGKTFERTGAEDTQPGQRFDAEEVEERATSPEGWQRSAVMRKVIGEGKDRKIIDVKCGCCGGDAAQHWCRVNLWSGHDYYYDADAVREPAQDWGPRDRTNWKYAASDTAPGPMMGDGHRGGTRGDFAATGRNLRSVWTMNTQPFPDAHYAVFPEELPRKCILAGTSERGCCPECGAPWERVVEKDRTFESGSGRPGNMPLGKNGPEMQGGGETLDVRRGPVVTTKTVGWRPTCDHDAEPVPCVVLDPFVGTGTTLRVAKALGRHGIGIELSADYCAMAVKRCAQMGMSV